MLVVLDVNALLVSVPKRSPFRPILDNLLNRKFDLILSNEILSEYIEVFERKANSIVATNIAEMLLNLDGLKKVDVYFEWNLVAQDPDDNKYVDAAIAGGADYLVTNDQHFKVLKTIEFPKVRVISIENFLELINIGQF